MVEDTTVSLVGDVNSTTEIEIIGGAPRNLKTLQWNDKALEFEKDKFGVVRATIEYVKPEYKTPNLSRLEWRVLDSLPEVQSDYSDAKWPNALLEKTANSLWPLKTPTSLYSGDYGFHSGMLLYRGHFVGNGKESNFSLTTQGGAGYGHSAWLDDQFLGSFTGEGKTDNHTSKYTLPITKRGQKCIFTIAIDTTGYDENYFPGADAMKNPRGILDYNLEGHESSDIQWKITRQFGRRVIHRQIARTIERRRHLHRAARLPSTWRTSVVVLGES